MSFESTSKIQVLEAMQAIHRNGQILEIKLRFANKKDRADQVWASNVLLGQHIDILIGKAIDDWLGDADAMVDRIEGAAGGLQKSIDQIADTIKTGEKVVKAIGYIDDAVKIAAKLAKYL